MTITTIINNLKAAIAALEAEPDHLIDLRAYIIEHDGCNTLHCSAGLLATTEHFKALGWRWSADGGDVYIGNRWIGSLNYSDPGIILNQQLGSNAFDRLFHPRNLGAWDFSLHEEGPELLITDKDLALARLRRQLKEYEQ